MAATFTVILLELQPSQLYISSEKLAEMLRTVDFSTPDALDPLPIKRLGTKTILTDGHTRAFAAFRSGLSQARAFWDTDELDWEAYQICVDWCIQEGISSIADLADRVVSPQEYDELWHKRCDAMHRMLEDKRRIGQGPAPIFDEGEFGRHNT